jgi:hypothetical protein
MDNATACAAARRSRRPMRDNRRKRVGDLTQTFGNGTH